MTFQNPHIILMCLAFPIGAIAALYYAVASYYREKRLWRQAFEEPFSAETACEQPK